MKPTQYFSIAMVAMFFSSPAWGQAVGMGTTTQGSFTYSAGSAIAKVAANEGIRMRVQPHGGTSVFVPSVDKGELEFGMANHLETIFAIKGSAIYKDRPHPNLRVVTVLSPLHVAIFTRKDSDIKSLKELKGKLVPGEFASQRIIKTLMEGHLANAGLSYADVQEVKVPNVIRAADDFATGKADVFFFAVGSAKILETSTKVGGIRALGIDSSPNAVAAMRKFVPVSYADLLQPAEENHGVVGPTHVMAYDYLVLTNANVPDDVVYKLTKAMYGNKAGLVSAFKALDGFEPNKMAKDLGAVQYHPGAIKFYTEKGTWPPKS